MNNHMRRHCCVVAMACVAFVLFAASNTGASDVLVSVQTKTAAEMEALTAALDDTEHSTGSPPNRVTLGAIEATMSKVVDVEEPYLRTVPEAVPMLTLLSGVSFDTDTWVFNYESMDLTAGELLNQYNRVVYFSKNGNSRTLQTGDTENACLDQGATHQACVTELNSNYYPLGGDVELNAQSTVDDKIEHGATGTCNQCTIQSTMTPVANSNKQNIQIRIPHAVVRNHLGTQRAIENPIYGTRTQYEFGIGMVFMSEGNNVVMFDMFTVIENAYEQLALLVDNEYSVARHVSFWTMQAKPNPNARIINIEYLIRPGFELVGLDASINGAVVDYATCQGMQDLVNALETNCLTQSQLCTPQTYQTGSGDTLQTWATYVLPLPTGASSFAVNTLLTTRNTATNETVLSTLNFETAQTPQEACTETHAEHFDATQYVELELRRGSLLHLEQLQGNSFSVSNATALSMTESLMTLVIRPKNDTASIQYFQTFTNDHLALDELFMSHALDKNVFPNPVENTVQPGESGRTTIALDAELLTACPIETVQNYHVLNQESSSGCITTKDWGLGSSASYGQQVRTASAPAADAQSCDHCRYFVREVDLSAAVDSTAFQHDIDWLKSNVFGGAGESQALSFRTNVVNSVASNLQAYAKVYWVLPLYAWPDTAPMGLRDTVIVSLSWSLANYPTTSGGSGRRLLSAELGERMSLLHQVHAHQARLSLDGAVRLLETSVIKKLHSNFSVPSILNSTNSNSAVRRRRPLPRALIHTTDVTPSDSAKAKLAKKVLHSHKYDKNTKDRTQIVNFKTMHDRIRKV